MLVLYFVYSHLFVTQTKNFAIFLLVGIITFRVWAKWYFFCIIFNFRTVKPCHKNLYTKADYCILRCPVRFD